jgi:hypothetical protein
MTIPADRSGGLAEPGRDGQGGSAGANRTSLVCLTTYAPGVVLFCGQVYVQLSLLSQRVQDLERRLDRLGTSVEQQGRQHDQHVAVLAACQRDTAGVLNHELEQHALHPAIEAVVALAAELSHLQGCASQLVDAAIGGDGVGKLQAEIDISCSVARERLAHLDVQRITPLEAEEFDPTEHVLCGCVETADESLHRKISKLVAPGIVYRGKVLRPARVLAFRVKTPTEHE